jgi:RNA polymerase sigma-70 factor (ECF subfamily)
VSEVDPAAAVAAIRVEARIRERMRSLATIAPCGSTSRGHKGIRDVDGTTDEPERRQRTGLADAEFEALYRACVGRVYAYLARRVGPTLAEDLTAQVFAEAWAGRTRYDAAQGAAIGWIFGIATNILRHHRRREETQLRAFARRGVDPVESFDEAEVVDRVMVSDGWRRVASVLAELSEEDRNILTLAGWARLSYDDIAAALDMPVGTVKSRVSRTRAQLARRLASAIDLT